MALKPNDGETFLKEVDEELRKEQITSFFTRYGMWIITAAVLILGGVGGWIWWSGRQTAARENAGESLVAVMGQVEGGNQSAAALPQIDVLASNDIEGYRAGALFARATVQAQSGNVPAAIATLRAIGDDQSLDQVYRDAALIRRTQLEFDNLPPQEVIRRLNALATGNGAWAGPAGELVGVAHLKMNRPDLAGPVFVRIARDTKAAASLRDRAASMASSLGFDPASDAPRSTAPARPVPAAAPAANAQAPAASAAPAQAPAQAPATREKAR